MLVWGKKWGWMELARAAFAVATVGIVLAAILKMRIWKHYTSYADAELWVDITVLQAAVHDGAVCLDGSPPAYHWHPGTGSGSRNWIVFLEGGAWCSDHASCAQRARTSFGSSDLMDRQTRFLGILSNSAQENPDFYNWNRVKVKYCDGASFTGNVNTTVTVAFDSDSQQALGLMYRGEKIWKAVISDLLSKGMSDAEMALLGGCSAGGLAATLHCSSFKELLPRTTYVKCVSDGGYFLDAKDIAGNFSFRSFFKDVVDIHNARENLPEACVAEHDAQCFFPQYVAPHIHVPIFFVNPAYDVWQIQNIFIPDAADPDRKWTTCKYNPYVCSQDQLSVLQGFRMEFLKAVEYVRGVDQSGLFIDSCFSHCQLEGLTWNTNTIGNKTIREAFGDWYFARGGSSYKSIDCPYPCNPTCIKWTSWRH
ncbi:pectin acetylesterase 8 [Selaginella moellendorffii]|nr:pectin acetylesterase 8 [Selaginella moellendorffii]XP_024544479.1 pectin acetylesterase 8 [Selaginella moellendorffii]|eukprot:XP_002983807.2 pectin acetylesterase 8 [Selaginella moellendorffii]